MFSLPEGAGKLLWEAAERGRCYEYSCRETPLFSAVERDCDAALDLLLQAGYPPNIYEKHLSPLHLAARRDRVLATSLLLKARADPNRPFGNCPYTALHIAAEKANCAIIQLLVDAGAEPDVSDGMFKQTPLYLAAEKGSGEAVKTLLNGGADPNVKDSHHYTPLASAIGKNFNGSHDAVIEALLQHEGIELDTGRPEGNGKGNPLCLAVTKKNMPLIEKLLAKGADIDPIDEHYGSLLERVIRFHSEDLAILLINKGASPTSPCQFLRTPLHLAAKKGYVQLVRLLLEKGATNGQTDVWDKTALDIAREKGHNEIVELLENPPCNKPGN